MNTTTPAWKAGVAVKTTETGFAQHRKPISSDWACLELLQPYDTCLDAALTYTELGLVVIPDPDLQDSKPLPKLRVKPHWQQHPGARVGLLVGHLFDVLAVQAGPEQVPILQRLGGSGVLSSCFAQVASRSGTLLFFASSGVPSQRIGLAPQGVSVIGRSGRIDVTPTDCGWLFVDIDLYGKPLDLGTVRRVLT